MRRKIFSLLLVVLFISSILLAMPTSVHSANIWSAEAFQAMTPYGVPEAHDTESTRRKKPAIWWGTDGDGTVTFADGTYQYAYNASCVPHVIVVPLDTPADSNDMFSASVSAITNTYFHYTVSLSDNGSITDVTSTTPVIWVSFGWR